jgi:predicted nucleic acid-binding protein
MKDELFFDTNILCYAYDATEPSKRKVCEKLVEQGLRGEIKGVISNQVLVELFNACTRKLGVPTYQTNIIVKSLILSKHWRKIDYNYNTVDKALNNSELFRAPFLDVLMTETMKENGIVEIITENEKDFSRIPGIKVTNPLK